MPGGIGGPELLLVFLVVLLVFGPKKIPEVARGIGKGLREVRRLTTDLQREINLADELREPSSKRPPERGPGSSPSAAASEVEPPGPASEERRQELEEAARAYEEHDEQVLDVAETAPLDLAPPTPENEAVSREAETDERPARRPENGV